MRKKPFFGSFVVSRAEVETTTNSHMTIAVVSIHVKGPELCKIHFASVYIMKIHFTFTFFLAMICVSSLSEMRKVHPFKGVC